MTRRPPPIPPPIPGSGPSKKNEERGPDLSKPAQKKTTPDKEDISSADKPAAPSPAASYESKPVPAPAIKPPKSKIIKTDRMFGRFELLMEMARGGMATLFLARIRGPESFEKLLMLKKIHDHLADEEEFIGMFLDEARIAALIHHPNVATIFDMGQIDGSYFIAMEYVHGENLTSILRSAVRQKRTFKWPYAVKIIADAAAGLHAAHELRSPEGELLGVVHRDVSPQNILVSYDGHVKIVDFGIAYAAERISHTQAGTLKGKVSYMSPEQTTSRKLDRRSDVYSLGIVLYESVCLKRLFKEKNEAAALLRIKEGNFPKPREVRPDVPEPLERIILKALATDPDKRYQTAEDLEEAINTFLVSKGYMVGRKQVAKSMESLFYQRKKIKDEQIKRASESTTSQAPMRGFGMSGTSTSLEAPAEPSTIGTNASLTLSPFLKFSIIGAAALAVALAAMMLILIFRKKEPPQQYERHTPISEKVPERKPEPRPDPKPDPRPDPMKPEPEDTKPQTVTLKVVVFPKAANPVVHFRGEKYKGSFVQISLERSEEQYELLIKAPGYKNETHQVAPMENKELILTLTRRSRKPPRPRDDLLTLPE